MQTQAEYDALEAEHYRTYRAGESPMPVRLYPAHCPRCLRGIRFPRLLSRTPGTTDGPRICSSCIRWEQKWFQVERERVDRAEHEAAFKSLEAVGEANGGENPALGSASENSVSTDGGADEGAGRAGEDLPSSTGGVGRRTGTPLPQSRAKKEAR